MTAPHYVLRAGVEKTDDGSKNLPGTHLQSGEEEQDDLAATGKPKLNQRRNKCSQTHTNTEQALETDTQGSETDSPADNDTNAEQSAFTKPKKPKRPATKQPTTPKQTKVLNKRY